jgi:hypothetical protein
MNGIDITGIDPTATPTLDQVGTAGVSTPPIGLLLLMIIILGILILTPRLCDVILIFFVRRNIFSKISDISCNKENIEFLKELLVVPEPRKSSTRYSMMLGVILVIGVSMLYLLLSDSNSEIAKNTIGVLAGALASIVGFYFGGRAGELKTEELAEAVEKVKKGEGGGAANKPTG